MANRVTQIVREVLRTGKPLARVTQVVREILRTGKPQARVTQTVREVLVKVIRSVNVSDSLSFSDSVTIFLFPLTLTESLSDSITLSDSVTVDLETGPSEPPDILLTFSDSLTFSDAIAYATNLPDLRFGDILGIFDPSSDGQTGSASGGVISDGFPLLSSGFNIVINDPISGSNNGIGSGGGVGDSLTLTDFVRTNSPNITLSFSDTITIVDDLSPHPGDDNNGIGFGPNSARITQLNSEAFYKNQGHARVTLNYDELFYSDDGNARVTQNYIELHYKDQGHLRVTQNYIELWYLPGTGVPGGWIVKEC